MATVAVLGAGSWGTAMALHLARAGHEVVLWAHRPEHIQSMIEARANLTYLPDFLFPENLSLTSHLQACLTGRNKADYIFIAVPSHAFAGLLERIKEPPLGLTWLTKGVDPNTHHFLSELVEARFGAYYPIAVLAGPSFAKEVAAGLPTALTLAGRDPLYQKAIHKLVHHHNMRVYLSDDLLGVQLSGAVKNILAIACGISDGMHYGANAKAALITRGLAEMTRLGMALGARLETFLGLAGVGDLVLTCTDNQSRNKRFGLFLGEGASLEEAEKRVGQVVEGKHNAAQICAIAQKHQIEMPLCTQIDLLLKNKINVVDAAKNLMNRPPKEE